MAPLAYTQPPVPPVHPEVSSSKLYMPGQKPLKSAKRDTPSPEATLRIAIARTFGPGIRRAIFEGFVALFCILVLGCYLFFSLGIISGYNLYEDLAFEEFQAQIEDYEAERRKHQAQGDTAAANQVPDLNPSLRTFEDISTIVKGSHPPSDLGRDEFFSLPPYLLGLPLLLLTLAILMSTRITRSISNLREVAEGIEKADWEHPIIVLEEDEIGELARSMERMRRKIRDSQAALETANARLAEQLREQQYALQQARIIQGNFMPLHYKVKNCTVGSLFLPQSELSGDFFTFKELSGDRVAFIFGDIQGHGVPASLNMMSIVTSFRLLAEENDDPARLAASLNMICGHNAPRGPMPLVTAVIGVIDQHDGIVELVNAGHPSPLLLDTSEREVKELAQRDPILGLMPDYRYSTTRVQLQPEDKILCYTDGLTECLNDQGEAFEQYFRTLVAEQSFNPTDQFINIMREQIESFLGDRPQEDDILLSCISVEVATWTDLELPPLDRESAIAQIVAACARGHVPNEVTSDIHLALDELITNAIVHGNASAPEKRVSIRYAIGHGIVRIAIRDEGEGFVPDLDEFHLTSEQLMERGKRGIYLVKSLMDEMHYNEAGNEVMIVKRYHAYGSATFGDIARYDLF